MVPPFGALRQLALQHKDVLIREGFAGDEAVTFHLARAKNPSVFTQGSQGLEASC